MIFAVFQEMGMMFELTILLKRLVMIVMVQLERCLICIGAILSGPNAFDGFDDLMAVRTWLTVKVMGVVGRL